MMQVAKQSLEAIDLSMDDFTCAEAPMKTDGQGKAPLHLDSMDMT